MLVWISLFKMSNSQSLSPLLNLSMNFSALILFTSEPLTEITPINSSPPYLATTSEALEYSFINVANVANTLSPAWWPNMSLTALK